MRRLFDRAKKFNAAIRKPIRGFRNMLSHHAHFALTREHAEHLLVEVAGWEDELKAYYAQVLAGCDLDMAVDAVSSVRMLS